MGVLTFCCGGSAVRAVRAWVLLILRRVPCRVGRRRALVKTPLQLQGMVLCDLVEEGRGREGERLAEGEGERDRQETGDRRERRGWGKEGVRQVARGARGRGTNPPTPPPPHPRCFHYRSLLHRRAICYARLHVHTHARTRVKGAHTCKSSAVIHLHVSLCARAHTRARACARKSRFAICAHAQAHSHVLALTRTYTLSMHASGDAATHTHMRAYVHAQNEVMRTHVHARARTNARTAGSDCVPCSPGTFAKWEGGAGGKGGGGVAGDQPCYLGTRNSPTHGHAAFILIL
jgi:hypothetical protein